MIETNIITAIISAMFSVIITVIICSEIFSSKKFNLEMEIEKLEAQLRIKQYDVDHKLKELKNQVKKWKKSYFKSEDHISYLYKKYGIQKTEKIIPNASILSRPESQLKHVVIWEPELKIIPFSTDEEFQKIYEEFIKPNNNNIEHRASQIEKLAKVFGLSSQQVESILNNTQKEEHYNGSISIDISPKLNELRKFNKLIDKLKTQINKIHETN